MPSPKVPSQGSTSSSTFQSFDAPVSSVQGAASGTERLWIIKLAPCSLSPATLGGLQPLKVRDYGGRRCQLTPKWLVSTFLSLH